MQMMKIEVVYRMGFITVKVLMKTE